MRAWGHCERRQPVDMHLQGLGGRGRLLLHSLHDDGVIGSQSLHIAAQITAQLQVKKQTGH